jgi:predicted polyphosphate/ATP-dependent NAD kinase
MIDREDQRTALVPVPDASLAPAVARELVASGVELIEMCGGFDVGTVARVVEAVDGEVPVGHVTFAIESISGVAQYKARWEAAR